VSIQKRTVSLAAGGKHALFDDGAVTVKTPSFFGGLYIVRPTGCPEPSITTTMLSARGFQ